VERSNPIKRQLRGVADAVNSLIPRKINRSPIFILGNQKSGTSVIAGLLGEATGLSTAIDLRGIYEPVQTKLHEGDLSFHKFVRRNSRDFAKAIIKEPCLTLLVDQLDAYYNNARYVFVSRDPRQNIRSILNRLDVPGDLERIDEASLACRTTNWSGWRKVLDGRWLGIPYRDHIGALAGRWNLMTDIFEENRDRFLLMRYEDFLADKESAIHELAASLRLETTHEIADKLNRQYQHRGDRSVSSIDFFGPRNLERINSICAFNMDRLGYVV
jgi:hypothetical protein